MFAPIRAETFKLQLKAFQEVLLYFQNKSEADFLEAFDLYRIVSLNALRMADNYLQSFFPGDLQLDDQNRDKVFSSLTGAIVTKEYAATFFARADSGNPIHSGPAEEAKISNPAIILARWQKYEHGMVEFTKQFTDQCKELDRLAASPLLPKTLRDQLGGFTVMAREALSIAGKVITKYAQQMPDHFPNASDKDKFSTEWIWNEFNNKRPAFEPTAKKILDYIDNYLNVEELMR